MSTQTTLTGDPRENVYRTIVKDVYSTRDKGKTQDTMLEIVVWQVKKDIYLPPIEEREGIEDPIKTASGHLKYGKILDAAMDNIGAKDLSRRTGLKSYADDLGGRAPSTIRGYASSTEWANPKSEGGLPSSHPIKRVLRRYARSHDMGHFVDDEAGDEGLAIPGKPGRKISGRIDLASMQRAYKLARSIASQNGFVFVPREGVPMAVEDNEIIDLDEIRPIDRPLGEVNAMLMVTKPSGQIYEYVIDLDEKTLEAAEGTDVPPSGWS